ncbi:MULTISPECIES: universal stress protein [Shewanella]|uniref:Universal stress protein A n=1 Tax=Shewanella fodinae TaxID=552357 RepID=A0A4V2RSY7_9GAMM|nr:MULTISPECIES: universal stress protein [Shewanella]MBO1270918.1 universal stress protein [Shewanella sp. 4t3-1-2LB]MCD8475694.1 universal stress protein [Shewanella fodinae]MCL2906994.1 universal stress protein [Shewanella fodinae]TCN88952.1 universal stress protein A [Shewanella fodinae]GGZ06016.1 universal stress protein A [Shewanella fodinae]
MRDKDILWPTDFSDTASHALGYAIDMANHYKVGLRILHVVDQPVADASYQLLIVTPEELAQSMEKAAADSMHKLLAQLDTSLHVETIIRRGDPVEEILTEAKDADVGMIVLASHGRSGLSHFLNTNVSEEIANKAICPVLVVK